jgi:hypothetical protein
VNSIFEKILATRPCREGAVVQSSIGCVPVTPKEVSNTKMSTSLLMWLEAVVWFEEDYFSLEQFTFAAEVTPIHQSCEVSSLAR